MPDEDGEGGSAAATRARKVRPEMEIYRPGMLRKGKDVTATGLPPKDSKPPEEPKRRPVKLSLETTPRLAGRVDTTRRRSNDTDSVHSYRADSGSTTPDAASICGERRDSGGRGGLRTFTRGGGQKKQQRHDDGSGDNSSVGGYQSYGGYNSRNTSQYSSRQSIIDDYRDPNEYRVQSNTRPQPYNSTQSLYDSNHPGGYLNHRGRRQGAHYEHDDRSAPSRGGIRFQRPASDRNHERASMRAEVGQRRVGGRKRNDSINSTQSERPPDPYMERLEIDTRSQAGDVAPSPASYIELCKSFESIGSFDWSKEMENESMLELERNKQEKTRQLEERLAACSNGVEVQQALDNNGHTQIRGILRVNLTDNSPSHENAAGASPRGSGAHSYRVRGRGRVRHDSDRSSSIGGSIAEEVEADADEYNRDRTPTREDKKWSSRGGRQNTSNYGRSPRRNDANRSGMRGGRFDNEYGNRGQFSYSDRDSKFRGDHDFSREELPGSSNIATSSRLMGRISHSNIDHDDSYVQQQVNGKHMKSRPDSTNNVNQRTSNRDVNGGGSGRHGSYNRDSTDEMPSTPRQMSDFPIYKEISKNEGPSISQINDNVGNILPKVSKYRDLEAGNKLLTHSAELSELYYGILTKDINFTFSMNLEQHLWKQAYHKMIESLKTASNTSKDSGKPLRAVLLKLLNNGIVFYNKLLEKYEKQLDFCLNDAMMWQNGLPNDDFLAAVEATDDMKHKLKISLKSASRLLLSLGDLHRYKTLVEGSEDYSLARSYYLRSSHIWSASGHAYNQLGVVAYFSMLYRSRRRARNIPVEILSRQRQERVLDEIFFCIRALAATHPFEAARERLFARLDAMKHKVVKYESLLDTEVGRVRMEVELAERADRPRELWMSVDGDVDTLDAGENDIFSTFFNMPSSRLHRRTISYIVHTAGLLITKIGMENFTSVSERAFCQLAALIQQSDSPITSIQLVEIAILFIYAVHSNSINGEHYTCSVQQQLAVQTTITFFGILLIPIAAEINELDSYITGEKPVPRLLNRVLPAVIVICEWFSSASATSIYHSMPSVEPLHLDLYHINTWNTFAIIVNAIVKLEENKTLMPIRQESVGRDVLLPELVFISSFLNVFPSPSRTIHLNSSEHESLEEAGLHSRLRLILQAAEYLDGSQLECFFYDETKGEFCRSEIKEGDIPTNIRQNIQDNHDSTTPSSKVMTREEVVERERKKQNSIVVKPCNLIPDTNAFVDHLDQIIRIVESGRFQVLVPTIVIEELLGLSQPIRNGIIVDSHAEKVNENAKKTVAWLREMAKAKHAKMNTLTTQGKKISISIVSEDTGDYDGKKVNDDRILESCVQLVKLSPVSSFPDLPSSIFDSDSPPIYRNVVLLSGDRGLSIKATSQNIPCRTLPCFVKWAKV